MEESLDDNFFTIDHSGAGDGDRPVSGEGQVGISAILGGGEAADRKSRDRSPSASSPDDQSASPSGGSSNSNSDDSISIPIKGERGMGMSKRYYLDPKENLVCYTCGKTGHIRSECPFRPPCPCCASLEHSDSRCNTGLCFNCFRVGHQKGECPVGRSVSYCKHCNMDGHPEHSCPDIWRSYLWSSKASGGGDVTPRLVVSDLKRVYCFNCGGSDHFGDECRQSKNSMLRMSIASASFSAHATEEHMRRVGYRGRLLSSRSPDHEHKKRPPPTHHAQQPQQKPLQPMARPWMPSVPATVPQFAPYQMPPIRYVAGRPPLQFPQIAAFNPGFNIPINAYNLAPASGNNQATNTSNSRKYSGGYSGGGGKRRNKR